MLRSMLCSLVMLCVFVGFAAASKDDPAKKGKEAKIVKVDATKKTVSLKPTGDNNEAVKTFKLAEEIEYVDSNGKVATIEIFTSGDLVLYVEVDGKVTKMTKADKKPEPK